MSRRAAQTKDLKDFQNPPPEDESANGAGQENNLTIEEGGCRDPECGHALADHLNEDASCSVDGCTCTKFVYPPDYDGQHRLPSEEFQPSEAEKAAAAICEEWQKLVGERMELSSQEKQKKDQLFTYMQNSGTTAFKWHGKTCKIVKEETEKLVIE